MISSAKAGISAKFSMQRLQAIFVINSNLNELMNDGGRYIFPKSKPLLPKHHKHYSLLVAKHFVYVGGVGRGI
jgi:hypothetical protein